jgi:hypothetical protein
MLYAMLVVGAIVGLRDLGRFGPLPMSLLLDLWIIALLVALAARGVIKIPGALAVVALFAITRVFGVMATESPVVDALQAYKWVTYLFAFVFATGKSWGPVGPLIKLTWFLVLAGLGKAAVTWLVLGPGERPGLLVENNFEIALFCGLVAVLYRRMERGRVLLVIALAALILLSGSRSGAVAFLVLAVYVISQRRVRNALTRYFSILTVAALASIPVIVFESRSQGTGKIDRQNFLEVFQIETRDWTLLEWLFGTVPITPLQDTSCSRLSFYRSLFSSLEDGSCYSVILHAFTMRVVFDAGLLGLALAFTVAFVALRRSGNTLSLTLCLLGIAFVNGLSVSGLNNAYVALPILLAILLNATNGEVDAVDDAVTAHRSRTTLPNP